MEGMRETVRGRDIHERVRRDCGNAGAEIGVEARGRYVVGHGRAGGTLCEVGRI